MVLLASSVLTSYVLEEAKADLVSKLTGLEVNIRNLNLIDMICSGDGRIWYCGE